MLLEHPVKVADILVSRKLCHRLDRNIPAFQPLLRFVHPQLKNKIRNIDAVFKLEHLA